MLPQPGASPAGPAWYPAPVAPTVPEPRDTPTAQQPAQPAPAADRPRSEPLKYRAEPMKSIVEAGALLATAARLWWRHWPVLFALCLFGIAAKHWLLQAGVWVSDFDATLGLVVFLTGPLVLMACLVLMLTVARGSSPTGNTGRATLADHLRQITSLLIPFLGVYAALGLLRSDFSRYYYEVFVAEVLANPDVFTNPGSVDVTSRLPLYGRMSLIAGLAVVVALRWLVPRWQDGRAWLVIAVVSAYLEMLWVGGLARQVGLGGDWLEDRQVFVWLSTFWMKLANAAGPAHGVVTWVGAQLANAETVLLAPVAWLLLGLVIARRAVDPSLDGSADAPPPNWLATMPRPVQWLADGVRADLRTRFGPLANGVRLIVRVGLIPMALLCVLVPGLLAGSRWLWEIERLVIGPQDLWTRWAPLSYWLSPLNDAVAIVAVTCLVAAMVERVARRRLDLSPSPAATAPAEETTPAGDAAAASDPAPTSEAAPAMPPASTTAATPPSAQAGGVSQA
ncbi:MAG: hypothetical protein IRY85_13950 [Micromonosporaceae bacterium]|nr:hypothetical protein [Micromonosporaceae bacterium]